MPTTRHRFTVTETEQLAHALDRAAEVWPEDHDDRGVLLRRLIERGAAEIDQAAFERRRRRRAALRELSGSLPGVYPPDARQELLDDWPE